MTLPTDGDDISTKRLIIDSRDRDSSLFSTPAEYEIDMIDEMLDVESVQLLVADVPFSGYMVSESNRRVHFCIDAIVQRVAVLTIGDYVDATDLATELALRLGDACADAPSPPTFNVTFVPRTDNFTISASCPFMLLFLRPSPPLTLAQEAVPVWERPRAPPPRFMQGTAARLLGFGCANYTAAAASPYGFSIVSPFRKNFEAQPYLVLTCDPAKVLTSSNDVIMDAFVILTPRQDALSFMQHVHNDVRKTFSPIIPKLRRLRIRFQDYDGNLYDFQNRDHRFELLFKSMRSHKYRRFD